jgi:acyl-coenzyme A synthetase/AMP-(fatty) acid ligase
VRRRAEHALPGCFIQENFGMAEALIMFVRSSDPPEVRRETCGRPASPGDEVYLVDEDGKVVPDGEPGELIVRGRLREKIMSGSDHPSLPYDRILREWEELGYDRTVMDLVFHANAERVLGL